MAARKKATAKKARSAAQRGVRRARRRPGSAEDASDEVAALRRAVGELAEANRNLESRIEERTRLDRLIRDVSRLAGETEGVPEMLRGTLCALCERGGWSLAHVFYHDPPTAMLLPSRVWEPRADETYAAFRAATEAARAASEDSAIASVFAAGQPREVYDPSGDLDPERPGLADTGLRRMLLVPISAGSSVFGVLELYSVHEEPSPEPMLTAMGFVASELGQVMLRETTEALAAQMESDEQQRIARDLHDGLGQRVSGIAMLAHRLRRSLEERESEEAPAAARLSETIEEAKVELRALVRGLMPVYPGSEGLVDALYRLVDESTRASGIQCTFEASLSAEIEDGFITRHLYFIAQEALRNALRHARASRVEIELAEHDHRIVLSIRDDGIGFSAGNLADPGSGLRIMRHRAALLTARLVVDSAPGQGTTVRCRLAIGTGFARPSAPARA
jgi:signal transduction histidine kinase